MMETGTGTQLQVSATQEVSVSKFMGDKKVSNMELELFFFAGKNWKNKSVKLRVLSSSS